MPMDSANQEVWIGVDVGTTGVRAIAYTEEGTNVCSSEAFYPLLTPHPDWAEESPLQIYEAIEQVVRKTADQLRYKNKELAGVALSTVMHSFAGLDDMKEPLMDMQTWADSRSTGIVREMKKNPELCRSFYERTGCPIHACYPLAKIIWLRENQPELFKQMKYVGSLKDYIFYNMTGEWVIDKSAASTSGMYNEHTLDWDDEILAYAGVTKGLYASRRIDDVQPSADRRSGGSHASAQGASRRHRRDGRRIGQRRHRRSRTGPAQRHHWHERRAAHADEGTDDGLRRCAREATI